MADPFTLAQIANIGVRGLKGILDSRKAAKTMRANEQALGFANAQSALSALGNNPRQFAPNLKQFKPSGFSNFLGGVGTAIDTATTAKQLLDASRAAKIQEQRAGKLFDQQTQINDQNIQKNTAAIGQAQTGAQRQFGADLQQAGIKVDTPIRARVTESYSQNPRSSLLTTLGESAPAPVMAGFNQSQEAASIQAAAQAIPADTRLGMRLALEGNSIPEGLSDAGVIAYYETTADRAMQALNQEVVELQLRGMRTPKVDNAWAGKVSAAQAAVHKQLVAGTITPQDAFEQVDSIARTHGAALPANHADRLMGQFSNYALNLDLNGTALGEIGAAQKTQLLAGRTLERMQDNGVRDALGRLQGRATEMEAFFTGKSTMPQELVEFMQSIGFTVDEVQRNQTGAAISVAEQAFYKSLVGSVDTSPEALEIQLDGLINSMQDQIDSRALSALKVKYSGRLTDELIDRYSTVYRYVSPRQEILNAFNR